MSKPAHIIMMCAVLGAVGSGCGDSAPATPTWARDVQPILAANCIKCHIAPPLDGAPEYFRLDSFEDVANDEGIIVSGAQALAPTIATRVEAEEMPPRFPLTSRQIDTLVAWFDQGAEKGGPKPGNTAPTMEATLDSANETDGFLTIPYLVADDDFDIVLGSLSANGATDELITRELHSGSGEAIWDVGAVAEGSYDLVATIDDGSVSVDVNLGSFDVAHGDGNTAPRIAFDFPAPDADGFAAFVSRNRHTGLVCNATDDCLDGTDEASCMDADFLCANATAVTTDVVCDGNDDCGDGSDEAVCACGDGLFTCGDGQCIGGTDVRIQITITDPDAADTLTMTAEAFFRSDQIIPIVTDVPAAATIDWDTSGLPGNVYRIRVTASDGTTTRTATSAPFTLN